MSRRLMILLATLLVSLVGGLGQAAVATVSPPVLEQNYGYDTPHHDSPTDYTAPEHGPRITRIGARASADQAAVDRWSLGTLALVDAGATAVTYTYDGSARLVQVASTGDTGTEVVEVPSSDLSRLQRASVAAKSASKLAPKLDDVFSFPGAGRSGAGVKNFIGVPSTIARGASPGRVFVTDDKGRVILDITRDRVKPVLPGQGFVKGDGLKLAPTSEQLGWIDGL